MRHPIKPILLNRGVQFVTVLSAATVLFACSSLETHKSPVLKAATGGTLSACAALLGQLNLAQTRIESASPVAADALSLGDRPVPAHCLVKGKMHQR